MAALARGGDLTADSPGTAFDRLAAAGAAYTTDRFDEARQHLEAAFVMLRAAGELRLAARVGSDLAEVHNGELGNAAAAKGWLERTRRVLEKIGPCVEWGYWELAFVACIVFCLNVGLGVTALITVLMARYAPLRGAVMGLNATGQNVGIVVGTTVSSVALGFGGYPALAATLAAISTLALGIFLLAYRRLGMVTTP